jgi:hypothetical protein
VSFTFILALLYRALKMEERHREIITRSIEHLVAKTSDIGLEMLVNYLVRDGVFTEPMTQKYMVSQFFLLVLNTILLSNYIYFARVRMRVL